MMLVVTLLTLLAIFYAERSASATAAAEFGRRFQADLDALHQLQAIRQATLVERCRSLVRKPRLHAALEDNALDLLYPSAEDELRELTGPEAAAAGMEILYYRFLDRHGAVIRPQRPGQAGELGRDEALLGLPSTPENRQLGYLARPEATGDRQVSELVAMPIRSGETGEAIATLVLGFRPIDFGRGERELRSGLWLGGRLWLSTLPAPAQDLVGEAVAQALAAGAGEQHLELRVEGEPCLLFFRQLNPGSLFPPACEVCLFPLEELAARRRQLRWQIGGLGTLLLLGGFVASNFVSVRLSRPVEKLAKDSEQNLEQRRRAEHALHLTSEELQRSVRFSSDASHQLRTPVAVLRAGLEELLLDEELRPAVREELAALIHQTLQLGGIIDDLLLLSRMEAGHLRLEPGRVDLVELVGAWLDDLGVLPDPFGLSAETELPAHLWVQGEKRYTSIIVQNLLENARKYNRERGRILISGREAGDGRVVLLVGNTGAAIPAEAQAHVFERFHRGGVGEKVAGHGLGLNLARELASLHGGELQLLRSENDWTEFQVSFVTAPQAGEGGAA
jgi:signal transduction histidine kinase